MGSNSKKGKKDYKEKRAFPTPGRFLMAFLLGLCQYDRFKKWSQFLSFLVVTSLLCGFQGPPSRAGERLPISYTYIGPR
jgi:hypothetical protein